MRLSVQRTDIASRRMLSGKRFAILGIVLILGGVPLAWPRAETVAPRRASLDETKVAAPATSTVASPQEAFALPSAAGTSRSPLGPSGVQLCQALSPAAPNPITGVDCIYGNCGERGWDGMGPIDWQAFAQGEYVGHARIAHVPEYRLRVDDLLNVVYRLTRDESSRPYQLNVGDEIRVEVLTDEKLNRNLIIQPDGSITMPLLGQVPATRRTVTQLNQELEEGYKKFYKPEAIARAITVTPIKVNTKLDDIRNTVDRRQGFGGQLIEVKVTPEGTIQLPAIGSVPAQGLTLDELRSEIEERYATIVDGLGVTPVLRERAPRYVFVLGEVKTPGRYALTGPTTVMQSISLAGGWNNGGNVRQIVVFRRGDDWRLMATMLDLRGALYGKSPCPSDEIWVNDSDLIVIPKSPILVMDNFIELVFTRGIYGVVPFNLSYTWSNFATLSGL